jgi:hypothetical protein
VPPPLDHLAIVAESAVSSSLRDTLYDLLRAEQAIAASAQPARPEVARILDFAQAASGDLAGILVGRDDRLLDLGRDGDWTLRDVIRHAMAVELRYAVQVEYSATRGEIDAVEIPQSLLPCDRLSPPEPAFAHARTGGIHELLELLGSARASTDARLSDIPDVSLGRPSVWGKRLVDVRARLHQLAVHLTETAIQVEKIVGPGLELRAITRRCCITRGLHERWSPADQRSALDNSYRALQR